MITFTETVISGGGNTTGIAVPVDTWHELTPAKRAAVTATVAGYEYRTTVGWYKGAFMLSISSEVRAKAGVALGDTIEVSLELDTAERVIEPPSDLADALATDAAAAAAWQKLPPSHKKAHVASIESAKTDATRERRVAAAIEKLTAP